MPLNVQEKNILPQISATGAGFNFGKVKVVASKDTQDRLEASRFILQTD